MRSTSRLVGVAVDTVLKLMRDAGSVAYAYHDYRVREVVAERVECDEVWAFCYSKQANVAKAIAAPPEAGHVWTWTAIDPDTKLIISWHVGDRSEESAQHFMDDLASRLAGRVQLTTDGYSAYEDAVAASFLGNVDYAQLVKGYTGGMNAPPTIHKQVIAGDPVDKLVSTSIIERHNLTVRMGQRRYTRLTNAFSKRLYHHCASLALFLLYYNFCRPHSSLRDPYPRTPAMAAGLTTHIRNLEWVVDMVDAATPPPKRPKKYRR